MAVFFIAFLTVLLAEMGDKTQLVTLAMATLFPPRQVLFGALAALAVITGIAVVLGEFLATYLPVETTLLGSGIFFFLAGLYLYFKQESQEEKIIPPKHGVAVQTFALVFLAELGDKTQLASIALTAAYHAPVAVFFGAMAGQLVNHSAAAYLGSRFLTRLPANTIKVTSALLFIIFGVAFIFAALRS
ncbi:MAG: hypothetical protein DDT30_00918 [Dehalococcoidia bacterium]|nr:hypothetical protein [Bacillota bacterium]MBT9142366.1 hypothetical protein [Bacillota bacterium]